VTKALAPSRLEVPIEGIAATAYTVPTESPESDGTLAWDETTVVIVEVEAGDVRGHGFSYTGEAAARVIDRRLAQSGFSPRRKFWLVQAGTACGRAAAGQQVCRFKIWAGRPAARPSRFLCAVLERYKTYVCGIGSRPRF
jgi:hypothetical protein